MNQIASPSAERALSLRHLSGPDAVLPPWVHDPADVETPRPLYDSVVVRGTGLTALVCAARLARSEAFAGRVTVAGPPIRESRRLIGGLTLRARALDYFSAALGCSPTELLAQMFGEGIEQASTLVQGTGICRWQGERMVVRKPALWMNQVDYDGRALAYGGRNLQIAAVVQRAAAQHAIEWCDEAPDSITGCHDLASGARPLVIDCGRTPLAELPETEPPQRCVVASQLLFTDAERAERAVLPDQAGFAAMVPRKRALDIGVYNPVADPLSPEARWYGIFYRIVDARKTIDREAELEQMRRTAVALGEAMGLAPHDESETLGQAVVPCAPWRDVAHRVDGVLELQRIHSAGAPIITGCGMARAGLAGLVAAEAILRGEDPVRHLNRSLRGWRRLNRTMAQGMTWLSPLAGFMGTRWPALALQQIATNPATWAGQHPELANAVKEATAA